MWFDFDQFPLKHKIDVEDDVTQNVWHGGKKEITSKSWEQKFALFCSVCKKDAKSIQFFAL